MPPTMSTAEKEDGRDATYFWGDVELLHTAPQAAAATLGAAVVEPRAMQYPAKPHRPVYMDVRGNFHKTMEMHLRTVRPFPKRLPPIGNTN